MLKAISIDSDGRLSDASNIRRKRGKTDASKIQQLACHPRHSGVVATMAMNGAILIWTQEIDRPYWSCQALTAREAGVASCIRWHPTKEWHLLAGGEDGIARLWLVQSPTQQPPSVLWSKRCEDAVRAVAWTAVGPQAAFACALRNGRVQVFSEDPERPAPILTMLAHSGIAQTLAWHPVWPGVLATGGRDCFVRVWDLTRRPAPTQTDPSASVPAPASVIEAICGPDAVTGPDRRTQPGPSPAYRFPASVAAAGNRSRLTGARDEWSSGPGGFSYGTAHGARPRRGQPSGAIGTRFSGGAAAFRGPRDLVAMPLGATSDASMSASAGQADSPVCLAILPAVSFVLGLHWRPGACLHIAANTASLGSCVKVWDISRPGIPVAEFNRPASHATIAAVAWVPREDLHALAAARSTPGVASRKAVEGSGTSSSAIDKSKSDVSGGSGSAGGTASAGTGPGTVAAAAAGSGGDPGSAYQDDSDSSLSEGAEPSALRRGHLRQQE